MKKPKITGLVIFHHEWKSLKNCVNSFLKVYPNSKIFISRDTRPMKHHSQFADRNVYFTKTYSSCQLLIDMANDNLSVKNLDAKSVFQNIRQELLRIQEVINRSNADYLLYMQADSLIRKSFVFDKQFDIDSFEINPYPTEMLSMVETLSGKAMEISGWGFVTHFANIKKLREVIKFTIRNEQLVYKLFKCDPRFAYSDYYFPILFHLVGGKIINSGQVGECLRTFKWQQKKFAFLHQNRIEY